MKKFISNAALQGRIIWKRHALQRMMERNISRSDVKKVLINGKIIEHYSTDHPFPSVLMFDYLKNDEPLHVVAALDKQADRCYIITAYKPDLRHFKEDFKTRR
ncbi:MAG: DUF4258 domain-containing protein [Balneolaceae bacterium]|nr:DUF4258 domain-containing protein [Balneolaceae bacterium]